MSADDGFPEGKVMPFCPRCGVCLDAAEQSCRACAARAPAVALAADPSSAPPDPSDAAEGRAGAAEHAPGTSPLVMFLLVQLVPLAGIVFPAGGAVVGVLVGAIWGAMVAALLEGIRWAFGWTLGISLQSVSGAAILGAAIGAVLGDMHRELAPRNPKEPESLNALTGGLLGGILGAIAGRSGWLGWLLDPAVELKSAALLGDWGLSQEEFWGRVMAGAIAGAAVCAIGGAILGALQWVDCFKNWIVASVARAIALWPVLGAVYWFLFVQRGWPH
jgi:hypothetical protein